MADDSSLGRSDEDEDMSVNCIYQRVAHPHAKKKTSTDRSIRLHLNNCPLRLDLHLLFLGQSDVLLGFLPWLLIERHGPECRIERKQKLICGSRHDGVV